MIYFAAPVGEAGPMKVGFTKGDAEARVRSMSRFSSQPLELIVAVEGDCSFERAIHAALAKTRLHGEWFGPSPALDALISDAKAGTLDELSLPPRERKTAPLSQSGNAVRLRAERELIAAFAFFQPERVPAICETTHVKPESLRSGARGRDKLGPIKVRNVLAEIRATAHG